MYYPRRSFLKKMGNLSATAASLPLFSVTLELQNIIKAYEHIPTKVLAADEMFWEQIRQSYKVSPYFINLENGYYSMAAEPVLEAQVQHLRMINRIPSFYMRRKQWEDYTIVKKAMADFVGCSPEEIVICRNTTEALDTIIFGLTMEAGDEAIMCSQDYGSMLAAFNQRARRDKIVNKVIALPLHPKTDQEIIDAYEKAITPHTKVILVSHLINITGQVLPVKALAEMAHSKGVEIISDSAHAIGQLDFKIPDLDCDYLGSSLHKWVGAPLGSGLMYIRKDKIEKVWPLFGDDTYADDDIRKFEHIGTHPCSTNLAIIDALNFQKTIGIERKEARLKYLRNYWLDQVKDIPRIKINTPYEKARSSAIANVGIRGLSPAELANKLFQDFHIFTVAIDGETVKGIRVTPHLYTSLEELDQLVDALKALSA
ncbi:aminotransferase class V-fold PLP-dependent enzyme [Catalinimonas niigatensis]|uniref:aminotransferase class V-fold PLP-dependent enzyme n=1 Tax=Catalinimonas niigatensis TaxID=1397264 RepID=UPI00266537D0|nr:aminotransferase class V-fold PLP-dependent enzyme [Catalinimonas niigatensis]WPP51251.1 aminotransferase class V-fold PLP-dependent enzyme [Catalinimonas niigatensis]